MAGSSGYKLTLDRISQEFASLMSPSFDTADDDDDDDHHHHHRGQKPSELYGRYTWKIEHFSQINKREIRSNAFEVGGYKWYILAYPHGCDVSNYLSLFLCVPNFEQFLPGWSHFALFTISVVNKDPKKSKYSDTLHRFWRKEHDWGWKKFIERSKLLDGFVDADTLVLRVQVQVIREIIDRPIRCLDRAYRRELLRVYFSCVEQSFCMFGEEKRGRIRKLIEDKVGWSRLCNFRSRIDQKSCRTDVILEGLVKHFFGEQKVVTETLMMEFLYSGLRALKGQSQTKSNKVKGNCDAEELPIVPLVKMESDTFIFADDLLPLLERAVSEPLPKKQDDGSWKDSIENDERRLTELGRRIIELAVLAYTSSKIELKLREDVALKNQEDLIREEEMEKAKSVQQPMPKRASKKRSIELKL